MRDTRAACLADRPQSQDPAKLVTTTVRDYDLAETSKAIRSVLLGIAMTGGMRAFAWPVGRCSPTADVYFKYTQPVRRPSLDAC